MPLLEAFLSIKEDSEYGPKIKSRVIRIDKEIIKIGLYCIKNVNLKERAIPIAAIAIPKPLIKARLFLPKMLASPAPRIDIKNLITPMPMVAIYSFTSRPMSSSTFTA